MRMNDATRPLIGLCLGAVAIVSLALMATRGDTASERVQYAAVNSGEFGPGLRLLAFVQPKPAEAAGPPGWLATLPPAETPVAAAPAVPAAPPPPPPPPRAWTDATYAQALLAAVNDARGRAGLAALSYDGRLATAASRYAYHLLTTGTFSHTGADGSTLNSRVRAAGFNDNTWLGEVIAMSEGRPDPSVLVRLWMDSPSHKAQILSSNFVIGGPGCAFDATGVRCVLDMAR